MQMEGIPILIIRGVGWGVYCRKLQKRISFQPYAKKTEQCLLLTNMLGGTVTELLRRFSHQSTAWRI